MTIYCLPARIGGESAARHFARPRAANLFGLLAPAIRVAEAGVSNTRQPPFVERIWMPAYAICLKTRSKKGDLLTWTSVEGISGMFALLEGVDDLAACDVVEDTFPPVLDESQAATLARHGLLRYIMAQRGQMDKPVVESVEAIRLYHFPVWNYYYRRFGRRIDFKVFDGYTGKAAGAKMRVAVLAALIGARKGRHDSNG